MADPSLLVSLLLAAALACGATSAAAPAALRDNAGCTVSLFADLAVNEPLIFQKECSGRTCSWKLPEGDEGDLHFATGEEMLVACTDKNNKFDNFTSQPKSMVAVCTGEDNDHFQVNGVEFSPTDFSCSKISKGEILRRNVSCGPRNAELLELGFTVRELWYGLIKVCHANSRSDTLYTEHTLQGETTSKRRQVKRPFFEEGGFYQGFSANDAYKNANKTLKEVTGYSKFPSSVSSSIDRGHLSPDGDFLLSPYRYSTYFYVNTVPMWSVINRGNWAALEEKIRRFAKNARMDLQVATGVFRVMELTDVNGNSKEFFLYTTSTRKQMPVPKFLWKVLYDEESKSGIAFVVLNNPFETTIDQEDVLCPDVCKQTGWNDRKWKSMSKGFLYCCEVSQLKKFISYVPKYNIKSILRGPSG